MNILTVSHLNKRFGEQSAIVDLSFSVPRQARMAIFAPSGSGKTTLLQILARLEQPDSGNFRVDDSCPVVIFQEPRLFPHLTVDENIFLPYRVRQEPVGEQTRQDYEAWLRVCELESFRQHFPHQLSGGMKQKVALIRGLLAKPSFVMMDEPFQSIGRQAKKEIIRHLLATNPGLAMLLVTHDPEEVQLLTHFAMYFSTNFLGKYNQVETSQNNFRAVW
jgi:ABC-type nitrate/sulfonate/bicarbonate transport system ATPase subunit